MKKGRPSWTQVAPADVVQRVRDAVRAKAGSDGDIWLTFNLQRWLGREAFSYWARRERRALAARSERPPAAEAEGPVQSLLASCLRSLQEALDGGTLPRGALPATLRAIADLSRLAIDEAAEKRAEEKHAAWREALRARQEAALETVSQSNQLTPEQVAEIRAKVLGL